MLERGLRMKRRKLALASRENDFRRNQTKFKPSLKCFKT
jgi:hypothetical protein